MTTKYSDSIPVTNPELPQIREVVEKALEGVDISKEQTDKLLEAISKLVVETIPELVFIDMSDSFLREGGFEECSKQVRLNLKKIGIAGQIKE